MPDPSYIIETSGAQAGLEFHLSTAFYPPLPIHVKRAFIEVFTEYWNYDIDIENLPDELLERAGYKGGLDQYNFCQFLNPEDLN